jgi:hypothetical protein
MKSDSAELGYVRLDAQSGMRNSDTSVTPEEFKTLSRCYYQMYEVTDHEFSIVTSGIKFIPNFINFRLTILYLWNTYLHTKSDWG